ncbi:MAG: glycosyltransferase family 4 protein [Candidatus Omnitrophota bacterium]|jgi:glycosyltransferase involved in cell wall biosynthesis
MRILLFTTHLNIGGIATYVVSLARALSSRGHDIFVASGGGALEPELAKSGIVHLRMDIITKSELSPKVLKAVFEISRIIKRHNIDIVHSQTRITQVAGFFVSRRCNIPMVTTCHGFFRKNAGRIMLPSWGDKVIAISDAVRENLINYFKVDEGRVALIYNGVDADRFLRDFSEEEKEKIRAGFGIKKGRKVIGMIARFTPDKGHDTLLYALAEIVKQRPDVQLMFVGDGDKRREAIELSRKLNLSENVTFAAPQLNTADALAVMDIFMFTPERREGLGLALLEALAAGKPVVATNVGGISSVVENGINGFLVEPSKPGPLAVSVLRLLSDKELCARMAQAGIKTVAEKFSMAAMAEKTEEVYKEAVKGGS